MLWAMFSHPLGMASSTVALPGAPVTIVATPSTRGALRHTFAFAQRIFAAWRALSTRWRLVSLALARRPRATANGFFSRGFISGTIACQREKDRKKRPQK